MDMKSERSGLLRTNHPKLLRGTCPIIIAAVHAVPWFGEGVEWGELFTTEGEALHESFDCTTTGSRKLGFVMATN